MNEQNQRPQQETKNPQSNLPWYAQSGPVPAPVPTVLYTPLDGRFSILFFLTSFLLIRALPVTRFSLGGTLTLMLLFLVGALYLRFSKVRLGLTGTVRASLCGVLSLSLITNGNNAVRNVTLLLTVVAFLCWIYLSCGLAGRNLCSEHLFSHLFIALFRHPVSRFGAWFGAFGNLGKNKDQSTKLWKTLGWVAIGLICAVIPTAAITLLLSYDRQFTALLDDLFAFSLRNFGELLLDLILTFPVTLLLFGGAFAAKQRREELEGGEEAPISFASLHVLPRSLLCAAVTPILALYVLFFISQWDYYVSAFTHVLPEELTYAAYAREGFFQLCTVCIINALLLWAFYTLARSPQGKPHPVQRIYAGLISVFTLILISTALSKMILYIDSYGLTQKRVYASWAMIVLAVIFVLVLLRQCIRKFPAVLVSLIATFLLFAAISLPNVDGMIASYNVDRYLSGELNTVDVEALADLGVSAVPALVKLENELTEKSVLGTGDENADSVRIQAGAALDAIAIDLRKQEKEQNGVEKIFSFSIPTARARALLEDRYLYYADEQASVEMT